MKQATAAIIGVGTEIMKGKIDDTNATFLSRWLWKRGVRVSLRLNVADSMEEIAAAFRSAGTCDLVVATGGLGPTDDDLTREALAFHLKQELVFDEAIWAGIKNLFAGRYKKIPESNKRQAMTICGAEVLPNPVGSAPGLWCEQDGRCYALLPGPPNENQPMVEEALSEKLSRRGFLGQAPHTRVLRCYHIGESALADLFKDAGFRSEVGYYFSQEGFVELHFTQAGGRGAVESDESAARVLLDERGVFYTEDADLNGLLLEALLERKLTIAFAESITGGAMAAEFVRNPGASQALLGGVVAYSNELKEKLLSVSPDTLREKGAVSEETVRQMAVWLGGRTGADISVAVSGVAGPGGGSKLKPVGLVHFGFLVRDKYFHRKEIFPGTRTRIIRRCIAFAFSEILKELNSDTQRGK